jgi:MATE family multidrug resistance protein
MFGTFVLDALAVTGQSLVAYFLGGERICSARKVARIVCHWSVWSGCVLGFVLWLGSGLVVDLLVPTSAVPYFYSAWIIAIAVQPLNALAFATDGLHWGSGDYRYLRNAVILATGVGAAGLLSGPHALDWIWMMTAAWIGVRATLGVIRIWPGVGSSPFRVEG